jgi:DNA-3-methyladenine glycosylase
MRKTLTPSFLNRPTVRVARELLGKYVVRRYRGRETALMITEVEAYDGLGDLASHAAQSKNARTGRAAIMFGPAGYWYVYFTYGMHWLANIVTGSKDYPAAILIRAGEYHDPKTGETARIIGPARLTKFLKIDRMQNGKPAMRTTGLWLEDRGNKIPSARIVATKRVGVDYAGPIWSAKEYNFKIGPERSTISRSAVSRKGYRS